jgi:hypothetical protein
MTQMDADRKKKQGRGWEDKEGKTRRVKTAKS